MMMTPADEIKVLGRLSQVGVAFLLGISTRSVRNHDIPRLKSGRYNAQAVVKWAERRAAEASAAAVRREPRSLPPEILEAIAP